jgi:hypothetical protein
MKLVRLIKTCLNEVYSKFDTDKKQSNEFPVENGLEQDALSQLFLNLALKYAIRWVQGNQE